MDKKHPLAHILRRKKIYDSDFDLVIANAYLAGQFGRPIPVDESRDCWDKFKELLTQQ